MQTGTVRYRNRRLVSLAVAAWAAAAAPGWRCRGQSAWEQGTAGAAVPRHLSIRAGRESGGFIFASGSAEQPWGLPGLLRTSAQVAVRRPWHCARMRWDRLSTAGFAEDLLEGSIGAGTGGATPIVHLVGRCARLSAEGFPSAAAWSAGWAVSADPLPVLSLEVERLARLGGSGHPALPEAGEGWKVSACAHTRHLRVIAALGTNRAGGRCLRLGLILGGAGRLWFALGARPDTGEVSGGLQWGGQVPVALSWRMHPALGTSFSVGAGVMIR
jgi:hypothetical protein